MTNLSHRIAKDSPFRTPLETPRLATTARLAGSRREFLKLLIPRNLRKRRLLQVSDLYRGFESFPLRHVVWTAEKIRTTFRRNTRNMPIFRDYLQTNRTVENGLLGSESAFCPGFSLGGACAVRFREGLRRMQCDQKVGGPAIAS